MQAHMHFKDYAIELGLYYSTANDRSCVEGLRTRLIMHSLCSLLLCNQGIGGVYKQAAQLNDRLHADPAVQEIEDSKVVEPAAFLKSRMTSHNLLVAVFTVSCVTLSTGNHGNTTTLTYPGRVFNTAQGECPSDDVQCEMVMGEVDEDIRKLLHMFLPICKLIHLMCNTDRIV